MFEEGSPRTHTEIRDREIAHEQERVQRMTLAMHEPLLGCAMNGMKSLHRTMAKGFNVQKHSAVRVQQLHLSTNLSARRFFRYPNSNSGRKGE